jgi:DNA-binding response OmpR family regulator
MPRILIVDDDEAVREVIKDNLSAIYEIIGTGEPESALPLTLEHKPDAILLDLWMPRISGFELCRALSSLRLTQQIPIFIISGQDKRNRAFCQKLGAVGYYTKPIDFGRLKTHLREVVRPQIERRADARVQLRVNLTLKGKDRKGNYFEVRAATENISKGGFLCACVSSLADATTVEVTLCAERQLNLGYARLVRIAKADGLNDRYGFQFIGTAGTRIVE